MRSNLLPHALNDARFAHLLKQHDAVDDQITADETGVAPMGDVGLEDLKKQRLHLKDELYRMASAVKP